MTTPFPTPYVQRLQAGNINYWEWQMRASDANTIGPQSLSVLIYAPVLLEDGTAIEQELNRISFTITVEQQTNPPPSPSPMPDPEIRVEYQGTEALTLVVLKPTNVQMVRLHSESGSEWLEAFEVLGVGNRNYDVQPAVCMRFIAADAVNKPPLPADCDSNRELVQELPVRDVFWRDPATQQLIPIAIQRGDQQVADCDPATTCEF